MKRTILAVLMVVMAATPCFAQGTSTLSTELQAALDRAREELDIVGLSAAVITPDEGLWLGVSGLSQSNPPKDIQTEMLFNIASTTKTFTATLVFQLVEEGILNLDDSVGDWLSDLPEKSSRWIDNTITIRQLLQHTSGIDGFFTTFGPEIIATLLNPRKIWKPEDTLRFLLQPQATPGEGFYYSNMNYILLGMIIEKATNSTIAVEFRDRFFDPLGLQRTFMSIEEPLDGEVAHGHFLGIDFSWLPREALDSMGWTSIGIFSTAEDMALWAQALFGGSVLNEDSLSQMLDFSATAPPYKGIEERVGLGMWSYEHPQFGEIWYHLGQWPFYLSLMGYWPDHDIVFVVLMNQFTGDQFDVMNLLLEAALK